MTDPGIRGPVCHSYTISEWSQSHPGDLVSSSAAMTALQRKIVISLAVVVAVTRWWAVSKSLWEWDEVLFSLGVRAYDVVLHHPHPPGFPLFILFGKAIHLVLNDEFRSLQAISFIGAALLFPAAFWLAREIGFSFAASVGGALLTVFAPNVWFFGGSAFSDVPSLTLVVSACAFLFHSRRAGVRSFLAGAALLGIAAAFRGQNLAIGFLPFLWGGYLLVRGGRWRLVAAGGLMTATIVLTSYVGAGLASSSWTDYRNVVRDHRNYITSIDSFRYLDRPSLWELFDEFFIRPFGFVRGGRLVSLLAAISVAHALVRRRMPPLILLGTFGPFAVMAWLVLDWISANRFSIGYLPVLAILASDGVGVLVGWMRVPQRQRELLSLAGTGLLVLPLVAWAGPAITEAHLTDSPPAAAVRWIRQHLSPQTAKLYVVETMVPISEYLLSDYRIMRVLDERAVPLRPDQAQNAYVLAEGATMEPSGINFVRSRHSRLWRIARPRYFEVSIIPLEKRTQFLDGWYAAENDGATSWRWMSRRSLTRLPPQESPAELQLTFELPVDVTPVPTVRLTLNGMVIDQFRGEQSMIERRVVVANAHDDRPNDLVIETDQVINPKARGMSDDPRDLGLRLLDIRWEPAPRSNSS
jgi:MFS family permease